MVDAGLLVKLLPLAEFEKLILRFSLLSLIETLWLS